MKKTLLFILICGASVAALVISGCGKKNDSSAVSMKSVAGTYKLTASTITYGGATVDALQLLDDCEKDDVLQLNADSNYVYTDAGVTCTPDGSSTGKWFISGTYFIQDGDTSTLKSFNGKSLVLGSTGTYSGVAATGTITLTKQ